MICAIVDMGSNTVRMSVYKVADGRFQALFSKKETAGLAGYINRGIMSQEGIDMAAQVLEGFSHALTYTKAEQLHVFATAALRNIENSDAAIAEIEHRSGFHVELISGSEEAELSFAGAVLDTHASEGYMFDLGGGSTEIVGFKKMKPEYKTSLEIGSLNLFKNNVERIIPKKSEITAIEKEIDKTLSAAELPRKQKPLLIGVGGTARGLKKLMNKQCGYAEDNADFSAQELYDTVNMLLQRNRSVRDLVLHRCPDRMHTIIPGALLVRALAQRLGSSILHISSYGVREGYLWNRVMKNTI